MFKVVKFIYSILTVVYHGGLSVQTAHILIYYHYNCRNSTMNNHYNCRNSTMNNHYNCRNCTVDTAVHKEPALNTHYKYLSWDGSAVYESPLLWLFYLYIPLSLVVQFLPSPDLIRNHLMGAGAALLTVLDWLSPNVELFVWHALFTSLLFWTVLFVST